MGPTDTRKDEPNASRTRGAKVRPSYRRAFLRVRGPDGLSLRGLGLFSLLIALLLVGANTATGRASAATATTSSGACTPLDLANETAHVDSTLNWTQATAAALSSQIYQTELGGFGPNVQLSTPFVSAITSVHESSCTLTLERVDVAYDVSNATGAWQLSVIEAPGGYAVANVTIAPLGEPETSGSGGQWEGWSVEQCSGCGNPSLTYSQLLDTAPTAPSNYCGATETLAGLCEISFWTGLTATELGNPTPEGIAQSGLQYQVGCIWVLFFYECAYTVQAWLQFYPNQQYSVTCSMSVSPSDALFSQVYWLSPNDYTAMVFDDTTGQECSGSITMAMGAPYWAQFQAESASNGIGGYIDVPNFNMWFNPMEVLGEPPNVGPEAHPQTSIPGASLHGVLFDTSPCPTASCSEISE
jgi:hypothetical protein